MKKFVNRFDELDFLKNQYESLESSLVIMYGRRRVGKTSLIREFIKEKPALYYLATEENIHINRKIFKDEVADFTSNSLLKDASVERWEPLFEELAKVDGKPIIVLDEFQYLGKSDPSFPSIFQKIWDTILLDKNVMVILCGSLISLMTEQTLSYSSPLYGRRTGQIKLKQIDFKHYNQFFPNVTDKELIELYSITGGVPKYTEPFKYTGNIIEDINTNILNQSNILYEEPYFLLGKEVSEIGSYFSILRAIAAGNHKLGKISSFLEIKQTGLTRYLNVLMDLDILVREVPVTEKNPDKSKKGLYKFKDNYLLFWFKFIYPNRSRIEDGHKQDVLNKLKANLIDSHVAYVYEDICRSGMRSITALNVLNISLDAVGRWWDKDEEIDVVALDNSEKTIVFGECKYWEDKVGLSVLRNLQKKASGVSWNIANRKEIFILFSMNGFTEDLIGFAESNENIVLHNGV